MHLRSQIKSLLAGAASASGALRLAEGWLRGRGGMVFMLHRVLPDAELADCYNPHLAVTPETLDTFLRFLRQRAALVTLDELLQPHPAKALHFALTFDDGWEDNFRVALPVLESHGAPATVYLISSFVGSEERLPEERLANLRQGPRKTEVEEEIRGALNDAKLPAGDGLHLAAKKMDLQRKLALLERLESRFGRPGAKKLFVDWDQARALQSKGIQFGSHTVRHAILTAESDAVVRGELLASRLKIEKELGTKVKHFAYPSGAVDVRTANLVADAGYETAVTTAPGKVNPATPRYRIPRIALDAAALKDSRGQFSPAQTRLHLVRGMAAGGGR